MDDEDEMVWRRAAPHVLAALVNRFGSFEDCEDALQYAALAAVDQWESQGRPDDPAAWLFRVASRRMVDQVRRDTSRRRRETKVMRLETPATSSEFADEAGGATDTDLLGLMMLCCHESLSRTSQVALMLRALAGLTTRQIAHGFMVPETTMGQRISRAKATLTQAGARFEAPSPAQLPLRALAVRHAVALLYTQGQLPLEEDHRADQTLRQSGIDLARKLYAVVPGDPENGGLLALLLLSEARAAGRVDGAGCLVPLDAQDRTRWDQALIAEGLALIERVLPDGYVGTFQLQAAIAAVHAEARIHADTDWAQILELYEMLHRVDPSYATEIGRVAALAEVQGPRVGLAALDDVKGRPNARYHAVRAHLLDRLDRRREARAEFLRAAQLTQSIAEQRYLNSVLADH